MEAVCQTAIKKGLKYICFTEHFDMNPNDPGYNFYQHREYTGELLQIRDKYAERITVLQGIEFSEPHLYPETFEAMMKYDFDFVLGSLHWLGDSWVGEKDFQKRYSTQDIYELHYQEVMKMVAFGGFDSVAHIDFPKRYLMQTYEPLELLEEIVGELVKKQLALEMNSSPFRKGYPDIFPSNTILDLYVKHGGSKVTVGSDAHSSGEIGQDFDKVAQKIDKYQLTPVIYQKRKEVIVV